MAIILKNVPAAVGGGRNETYAATKGELSKHAGAGGFKTVGSGEKTSDGGAKIEKDGAVSLTVRGERTYARAERRRGRSNGGR